jgi:hypothetical protein
VIECERGWRGQHAYPDRLYVPLRPASASAHESAAEIAAGLRDYGVPISLLRWDATPEVIATVAHAA